MMNNLLHRILTMGFLLGFTLTTFGQAEEEKVCFSDPGGFYETSFSLSLGCLSEFHHVRYTTNGATPDPTSRLYEQPIWLDKSHIPAPTSTPS